MEVNYNISALKNNNLEFLLNKKPTDFSIDNILGKTKNKCVDNKKRNVICNKSPTTRPFTKIVTNPWKTWTPLLYHPEFYNYNYHQQKGYLLQQNLFYLKEENEIDYNNKKNDQNNIQYSNNSYTIDNLLNNNNKNGDFKHKLNFDYFFGDTKNENHINLKTKKFIKEDIINELIHSCKICDKVFGCSITLETHEKAHRSPRYECQECGKGFSQLRNFKYHLSVHRGTKEFAAECPECGKMFNDKGYLSSHLKIHRNRKEYVCPHCPKSFNQRVAFNMHVRIHTGVKPHKCCECGKRFSRKMLLKQHSRTHSGEKPYQCTVCGKTFADRSNMTLHHKLHSGIKPFACPICPKAFTKKHHLKTHINYHTGCKPYICPHPNCGQTFTQSSNMRTHSKKCQMRPNF